MLRDILQRDHPLILQQRINKSNTKNFQYKNEVTRDECKRETNTNTKGYKGKQT